MTFSATAKRTKPRWTFESSGVFFWADTPLPFTASLGYPPPSGQVCRRPDPKASNHAGIFTEMPTEASEIRLTDAGSGVYRAPVPTGGVPLRLGAGAGTGVRPGPAEDPAGAVRAGPPCICGWPE